MTPLGDLRIKSLGTAISGLLLVVAVLVIASSYFIVKQVDQIGRTWESFDTGAAAKADILSNLQAALGYGGVIHQFKNYVLRKDRLRLIKIQEKLFEISVALTAYQNLGIDEREKRAFAEIQETLSKYAKAVAIAERMVVSGATAQQIDKVVTIDDRSALNALAVLHEVHRQGRRASAQSVYRSVDLVKDLAPAGVLAIDGLLVILVVSFLWFTRSRLVRPLARLEKAMQKLASGDSNIDIPATARRDELGTMAKTVLVFKENAIQRKRAEEALQKSEARLAGILEIGSEAVVSIDGTDRIRLFNRGAQTTFGYAPEEVLGQPLELLIPRRFHGGHRRHVEAFERSPDINRTMIQRGEIVGLRKDGTEFPMEAGISRLDLNGDKIFTAMLVDISDRKQAKRALEEAKEAAELANRTKSEFLANMSHELRTPLNAILGFAEMINIQKLGPVGSPKYLEYAMDIHESGQHLLELINDILDLSKVESGTVELEEEEIVVRDLVKSVVILVKERAHKGNVGIETDLSDELPFLIADKRKLKQVLVNLMSNGVKFTEPGGKVTIKVCSHAGEGYVFRISDTGIGMETEDIPTAFSHFGQVDSALNRKYEGTGLGLPLTRALVEIHGGTLDLESQPGVGTTVTLRFPAERIGIGSTDSRRASV